MKKFALIFVVLMLIASLFGCGGKKNSASTGENYNDDTEEVREYVSLLQDKTFAKGFNVSGLKLGIYNDPIENFTKYDTVNPNIHFDYEKGITEEPFWRLVQFATRYPFHDMENSTYEIKNGQKTFNYKFTDMGNGVYHYDNQSKKVYVDTVTGEIELGLKGSECYKTDRVAGQEWPHLLISSVQISLPTNPTPQSRVKNSDSIIVNMDCKLNSFVDNMGDRADPSLHSAVCMFYAFVSYKPTKSNVFTDMIWLGFTIFDNRTPFSPGMSCVDDPNSKQTATGKWIYNIPTTHFFDMDNNLYDDSGEMLFDKWAHVNIDLYPYIEMALNDAQRGGCMVGATMKNLYINGTYFGFELPGNYDIDMSFKNFDITSNIVVEN